MSSLAEERIFTEEQEKKEIPTCNIMGVHVAAINMEWVLKYLEKNLDDLRGKYICVSNVHTTVMAYESKQYLQVQNGAVMAIPDGGPLSSVGRKRGYKKMGRVTGPSLMGELFSKSSEKKYRHYFYGSTEKTLDELKRNLIKKYPEIEIAGMYSPPFRKLTQEEDADIISEINNAHPDFVWVGLGAPKQEIWMAEHEEKINGLLIGVGAGFDYHAGLIKRAPKWMQSANLEWFYRLIQEPKRLFSRYWKTNWKFILNAVIKGK